MSITHVFKFKHDTAVLTASYLIAKFKLSPVALGFLDCGNIKKLVILDLT
jgi:hypothetical protein